MEERRDGALWRTAVLAKHLRQATSIPVAADFLQVSGCLAYELPEHNSEGTGFDKLAMRLLLDGHDLETRDYMYELMMGSDLFVKRRLRNRIYVSPDFNLPMDEQREKTLDRILFLRDKGVLRRWFEDQSYEASLKRAAIVETLDIFDHSLSIKLGVHMNLWGTSILALGTKRHHEKWLQRTENYEVQGCFAITELGHGSNVRGIETTTTFDASNDEFIIDTPCESAQKYWIGGAAKHATHAIVFSQLLINGRNEGLHAFICQLRDGEGRVCPGIRIADCGHKTGLNGVDNGRIWFDKVRIPRENILNAVADVTADGVYRSAIKDPDQRFGALMAPLTFGRVIIAVSATNQAKVGLATAIRYSLSRRAFSQSAQDPEILLLDYPSHRHRLLPLLAKTYAMSFAAVELKKMYTNRRPEDLKKIHVLSSGFKAMLSWHMMHTLQECREACGGQGLITDNRIGQLKMEYDVQLTFEGDNNVLMQQVSKELLNEYFAAARKGRPIKGLGLEFMNGHRPIIPQEPSRLVLRDHTFQMSILQLRVWGLLELLVAEVKGHMSTGISEAEVLNSSYQLAEELGKAFSELFILDSFLRVEQETEGHMKELLGLLRTLYVMSVADKETSFLRYGYLSPEQAQPVHREVAALCTELRPQALNLVDAFGIPQPFLGAIACDWVEYNSWQNVL